jgi:N-acetylglucosaminyl-diphospho-decaprenol L-rhamnosyltransferase
VSLPPIAVAVVSWNTRALLAACLESLRADHDAGRAEIWVVDNASTDGSAAMVAADFPWVRLLEAEENLGFGPAVNRVAEQTSTPFLAAANSDLVVTPGALAALLAAATEHPGTGAFAPRLLLPDGSVQHAVHPFPTARVGLLLSTGLARRPRIARGLPLEGHFDPELAREVDWAHGALLLVRRTAWDEVGGFDAVQWLYAEDLDLGWRLARAGWPTRYVPAAHVHHVRSAATATRWSEEERAVRTQRSAYAWMLGRWGGPRTRASALAHLAGPALRLAWLAPAARLRPSRFAARAGLQRRYLATHRTGLEPRADLEAHRRRRV